MRAWEFGMKSNIYWKWLMTRFCFRQRLKIRNIILWVFSETTSTLCALSMRDYLILIITKPNWTICVQSALIDVSQNTIYSLNLIKKQFSRGQRIAHNEEWWVIRLWNTRRDVHKRQRSRKTWRRNVGHGVIGVLYSQPAKLNLAESNLIWFARKKKLSNSIAKRWERDYFELLANFRECVRWLDIKRRFESITA